MTLPQTLPGMFLRTGLQVWIKGWNNLLSNSNTKNRWGKVCASKYRLVHLLGIHWIFGCENVCCTAQQCSGFTLITALRVTDLSMCVLLSYRSCTPHDRTFLCSLFVPVCSSATVLWHAVVQLIWATLVKSPSLICSRYALLTCADNTALSGFIFFIRLLDVSLHRIIIPIHFPLIYAIWWALTHKSLYEWMAESVFPLPHMTLAMISASPISVRT